MHKIFTTLFVFVLFTHCSDQSKKEKVQLGHPFDSVLNVLDFDSEIWQVNDAQSTSGDSIMFYPNGDTARIIHYENNLRHGETIIFDSARNWTSLVNYFEGRLVGQIHVFYAQTGLIKYQFQLYDRIPVGEYLNFYNYHHDSVFSNGYIYPRSTHLKEYRFYGIDGTLNFKRLFNEDLTIKSDSGHSAMISTKEAVHLAKKETSVLIWLAQPYGTKSESWIRNNQTNELMPFSNIEGEFNYSFTPNEPGFYRFTIFHNLKDTVNNGSRMDSVTYRLEVVDK